MNTTIIFITFIALGIAYIVLKLFFIAMPPEKAHPTQDEQTISNFFQTSEDCNFVSMLPAAIISAGLYMVLSIANMDPTYAAVLSIILGILIHYMIYRAMISKKMGWNK